MTLLPLYVGHLLATAELFPARSDIATAVAAAAAVGPLFWAAVLLVNDVSDLPGDRHNPRRQSSRLVRGVVAPSWALRTAVGCAALALACALAVNGSVALLTGLLLALGVAYSTPPLRLKVRPGADVVVNSLAVGGLTMLAGWSATRPVTEFPWVMLGLGVLVAAALYVPTTLVDLQADRASGYVTIAVHLGADRAYRIGCAAWCAACAGSLAMAATGTVLPRRMLPILLVVVPLLIVEYAIFIGRPRMGIAVVRGIIACSVTFLLTNAMFALQYAGVWR